MKKNIAMRVAAFLFILTMISTCAFATTFAKYTTDGTATDTARVAKWGVKVEATNAEKLFASTYNGTVTAADSADVVAPGTEETFGGFTITGTPEVSVNVTYTAELTLDGWKVGSADYCPIVIIVNGTPYSDSTMTGLISKVEAAIAGQSKTYNVADYSGTNPIVDVLEVSWYWAFDNTVTGAKPAHPDQEDDKDTALGDWERLGNAAPTIKLDITCTVTQID